jgi:hypothetical protein
MTVIPNIAKAQEGFVNFASVFQKGAWKNVKVADVATFAGEGVKIYGVLY